MSHGGGGGEDGVSAEPNLTPLLDLVLQLVMFFMLVANFVADEMSDKIKLPVASQAKPLKATETNFMYMNVDKTGHVLVPSREPLVSQDEITFYLRQTIKNHPLGARAGDTVTVIIRADKDSKFKDIHKTMVSIKTAGFKNLQLRAELPGAK